MLMALTAFILLSFSAFGQTRNWDSILDRYEYIYAECVAMKAKVAVGEKVSKRKLASMLEELGDLRSTLQSGAGEMNERQRARFTSIRAKYTSVGKQVSKEVTPKAKTAKVPAIKSVSVLPKDTVPLMAKAVPATVDTLPDSSVRPVWDVLPTVSSLDVPDIEVDVTAPVYLPQQLSHSVPEAADKQYRWSLSVLSGLYPDITYGAMLTFQPSSGPWGTYASYRNDFKNIPVAYSCLSDGTAGGENLRLSGALARHRSMISLGPTLRLTRQLSAYTGIGYGEFSCCWEDSEGNWAEVEDCSCRGFSCEGGLLLDIGRCRIGAGAGVTAFRYSDFVLSVGLRF